MGVGTWACAKLDMIPIETKTVEIRNKKDKFILDDPYRETKIRFAVVAPLQCHSSAGSFHRIIA